MRQKELLLQDFQLKPFSMKLKEISGNEINHEFADDEKNDC